MDVLTALIGMTTLITLDDKKQLVQETTSEGRGYLWDNSNLPELTFGGKYPELETLTSSCYAARIVATSTDEWIKYKNTGELPMDSNLLKVLIGIRDFIELDNHGKLTKDGTFIKYKTIFIDDNGLNTGRMREYPEVYDLLRDIRSLGRVEAAIKELKLLQLVGMLDDTDLES